MVVILITAIRLCYRVEERSEALRNRTGVPVNANIPAVMFNWKVARDAETQALRRRMNYRLLTSPAASHLAGWCCGGWSRGRLRCIWSTM